MPKGGRIAGFPPRILRATQNSKAPRSTTRNGLRITNAGHPLSILLAHN